MEKNIKIRLGSILIDDQTNKYRIYHIDCDYVFTALMNDIDSSLILQQFDLSFIRNKLLANEFLLEESTIEVVDTQQLSDKSISIFKRNKKIIDELDKIYGPTYLQIDNRNSKPELIKLNQEHGLSIKSIRRLLKKYILSGKSLSSLVPQKGLNKPNEITYKKKVGRPSRFGESGVALNEYHRENLNKAMKEYLSGRQKSYSSTYDWLCSNFYTVTETNIDANGIEEYIFKVLPANERPTQGQMEDFIRKHSTSKQREVKKTSKREFRNDKRVLMSDSLYNVNGPGDLIEMDEVEMDVSLVSKADPSKVVGRPIVYVMIDVYSRMIVGVSVSFENNSVEGLTNCLLNMAEDKTRLCERYGIQLKPGIWDINVLPNRIRADRGSEYRSKETQRIFNDLGINLELVPAGTGSLKGVVEQLFHQFHSAQNHILEGNGLITKRHDSNHHKQATLNIDDVWLFVINQVLAHNMLTMHEYPMTKDMIGKSISPTPIHLWEYGCKYYGTPRQIVNFEQFEYNIRRSVKAKISRKGIEWNGLYYISPNDLGLVDLIISLGNKSQKLDARLDVRNVGSLWYIRNGQFYKAILNPNRTGNIEFDGESYATYMEYKNKVKEIQNANKDRDLEIRIARQTAMEATLSQAIENNADIDVDTSDLSHNRKVETLLNKENNQLSSRLENEDKGYQPKLEETTKEEVVKQSQAELDFDPATATEEDAIRAFAEAFRNRD